MLMSKESEVERRSSKYQLTTDWASTSRDLKVLLGCVECEWDVLSHDLGLPLIYHRQADYTFSEERSSFRHSGTSVSRLAA